MRRCFRFVRASSRVKGQQVSFWCTPSTVCTSWKVLGSSSMPSWPTSTLWTVKGVFLLIIMGWLRHSFLSCSVTCSLGQRSSVSLPTSLSDCSLSGPSECWTCHLWPKATSTRPLTPYTSQWAAATPCLVEWPVIFSLSVIQVGASLENLYKLGVHLSKLTQVSLSIGVLATH